MKLFEIKGKSKIDVNRLAINEARHLLDENVIKNIGADDFSIMRVVVSKDKTGFAMSDNNILLLVNIEDLLIHHKDLKNYLDRLTTDAKNVLKHLCRTTLVEAAEHY